jgi:hypothetical protein
MFNTSNSSLDVLPLELHAVIFSHDLLTFRSAIKAFKTASNEIVQNYTKHRFRLEIINENGKYTYIQTTTGILLHSFFDEPAFENDYIKFYCHFGKTHRINGPAIVYSDGVMKYCYNGLAHRVDGPAIIAGDDTKYYYKGNRHRLNGPAVVKNNVIKYFVNGVKHRVGGPAICHESYIKYYYHGLLHNEDGPAVIDFEDGCNEYFINGELHRENGPAVEYDNGDYEYFSHGILHRVDGPASVIKHDNGEIITRYFYKGLLHNVNGPAFIYGNVKKYYMFGQKIRPDVGINSPDFDDEGVDEFYGDNFDV